MAILSSLLLLFLFSIWNSSSTSPSDDGGHACVSQGGRFPKFAFEGKPPRSSVKGHDDLTLCRIYRKRTCCTAAQTHPALIAVRKLASNGEASEQCLSFWEVMECALCDPQVGVQKGPPALCSSFCDSSLEACKNAYFSFDSMAQVLQPCGPKDTICGRATEWAANGSHFCELAGFVVPSLRNPAKPFCFDGKPSLDADIAANKKSGRNGGGYRKRRSLGNILRNLITSDLIVWVVGGLVLTAGAILMSMHNHGIWSLSKRPVVWSAGVFPVRLHYPRVASNGNHCCGLLGTAGFKLSAAKSSTASHGTGNEGKATSCGNTNNKQENPEKSLS